MPQEVLNIFLSALGAVLTGLATYAVTKLTQFINTKIDNEKAANFLSTINELVLNCVQEINQTFVEGLKKEGKFDKEAQVQAFNTCISRIKSQIGPELLAYLTNNFGDINTYLTSLIESRIFDLKKLG